MKTKILVTVVVLIQMLYWFGALSVGSDEVSNNPKVEKICREVQEVSCLVAQPGRIDCGGAITKARKEAEQVAASLSSGTAGLIGAKVEITAHAVSPFKVDVVCGGQGLALLWPKKYFVAESP